MGSPVVLLSGINIPQKCERTFVLQKAKGRRERDGAPRRRKERRRDEHCESATESRVKKKKEDSYPPRSKRSLNHYKTVPVCIERVREIRGVCKQGRKFQNVKLIYVQPCWHIFSSASKGLRHLTLEFQADAWRF